LIRTVDGFGRLETRRIRARLVFSALVIAVVALSAVGGAGPIEASVTSGADEGDPAPARVLDVCPHEDHLVMVPYDQVLDPGVPGASDYLKIALDSSVQLASHDKAVAKFLHKLAREGTNPVWENFSTAKFDTTFASSDQTFTVDAVKYPNKDSAVILFTVAVDTYASQVPRVRATAQVAGRAVCEAGFWHVTLADVCSILARGMGPQCPTKVKKKARAALPRALKRAKYPEVAAPTVVTVPSTTSPPTTFVPAPLPPPPNFDGVCPYVGQPCSANVTNDPDCTCVPVSGTSFRDWLGVSVCRLRVDEPRA
jgi:hypothetical protein